MFPVKSKINKLYQPYFSDMENLNDQGINNKINMNGLSNHKGLEGFDFIKETYSVYHHKRITLKFNKLHDNEEIVIQNKPLDYDSDISSLTGIDKSGKGKTRDVYDNLNLNIGQSKQYKLKSRKTYSLKENPTPIMKPKNEEANPSSSTEVEINLKEYDTNKSEKATELQLLNALKEGTLQKFIFDCDYDSIENLFLSFDDEILLPRLINSEDVRGNAPLFLIIYLREIHKDNEVKRATYKKILELFLKYKVRIRIRNDEKRTPLEEAISYVSNYSKVIYREIESLSKCYMDKPYLIRIKEYRFLRIEQLIF